MSVRGDGMLVDGRSAPRVFGATALVSLLALVCNLALFWREILSAATFGVGPLLDAFIIASLLPVFTASLLAGALAPALAPVLTTRRLAHGAEAGRRLLTGVHLRVVLGSGVLAVAMWLLAEPLLSMLGRGLDASLRREAVELHRLLVPLLVLQTSSAVWRAVLNLDRKVILTGLLPALGPLLTVALLMTAGHGSGVGLLAKGLLAGAFLEWLLLATAARDSHGWSVRALRTRPPAGVFGAYATLVGAAALTTSAWFIDTAMASSLAQGSVAALGFGTKVVSFGVGIASIGISTAMLPLGAELVARREWVALRRLLYRYGGLLVLASLPATALVYAWSPEITALLYERGRFDPGATRLVGAVQGALVVQVPFHVLGVLCVRMLSAMRLNRHVMLIAGIGVLLNVVLNLALMPRWGVVGIAIATSSMFALTSVLAAGVLVAKLDSRIKEETGQSNA
jgi:putative peptidoglycan lipid II flippase